MRLAPIGWLAKLGDRGNVAIMTAVVLPLLLLVGGFATDYGYASYLNQRLTQATDNAVLASVSQSAATAVGGFANHPGLESYGRKVFQSNVADLPISNVAFNIAVSSNGALGVLSSGSYTYNYPTFFSGILGISQIPLKSQINASANPITYIDYYIVVDVSQSMGIGSTTADMNALWQRGLSRGAGNFGDASCVFGCHVLSPGQSGPQTNEQIAHTASPPIQLRIDAAVQAIQGIIAQAQSSAGTNQNIRIGLYTINRDKATPWQSYTIISKPSSDYSTLIQMANQIDLSNNTPSVGDTDFTSSLNAFSAGELILKSGSGASAVSPQNYVFLITDGLDDEGDLATCLYYGNTCTKPISPSACNSIKNQATLGVIYTVYNPIYQNNDKNQGLEKLLFKPLVAPFLTLDNNYKVIDDRMADNLAACSSDPSKYFFPASDGPAISTTMRALFASTLQNARLTQ